MNESAAAQRPPEAGQGIEEYYGWVPPTAEDAAARRTLATHFPDWSIIRTSDTGRWWALRKPEAKPRWRGDDVTEVDADTAEELRERLAEVAW